MNRITITLVLVAIAVGIGLLLDMPAGEGGGHGVDRGVPGDPAERQGALVDQVVFTEEADAGKVAGQIESGSQQLFAQGVTNATVFRRLRDSERAAHDLSYGSSMELTLNPAGPQFANGELNPFHVPEIREAVNWLIDRRYVAEELYGGLAVPRYLPLNTAFPDYARLADVARALELEYAHDPQRAESVIREQMEALGAERRGGRWLYEGEPVRISVLIRTEDERKRVGDYVANLFEDLGFRVERMYRTAEEASRIWIAGDPKAGRWHIYTGGWISTTVNRDLADNFNYYYTPRGRPDPLWQAYEPAPEFADLADRLARRDYATLEERQQMMQRALEHSMKNSARIWVVDQLNVWPRAADTSLAVDLAGGVSGSRLWPYTLRYTDRIGGNMVVAAPSILTEPWNPLAGSNWIFDTMITRGLQDAELLPDPFTGLFWPQRIERAEVTVAEDVPVERTHDWLTLETAERIDVPADAWIAWDHDEARFRTVGEEHPDGATARTRTRVYYEDGYLERQWHDGSEMSLADVVLPWILNFVRAEEDSPLFDPSHLPTFETFQRHFRGWRIVSREPLVIDIYSDQIYPDAETIVAARTPSAMPWHMLALGVRAEQAGDLAFSSNKADRMRVDWLSLVGGPSLAILDRHLQRAREASWLPWVTVLGDMVAEGEVEARYRALADWRAERRHFWIGDGPFYLHSVHPIEGAVVLRQYEEFPDPADKWLRFADPQIPHVELDGPMRVTPDEPARFEVRITFEGEPYAEDAIDRVQYLLFDGAGELAAKGQAEYRERGDWSVQLSAEQLSALGVGANSLEVVVTSKHVALPQFATHAFASIPGPAQGDDPAAPQAGTDGAPVAPVAVQ